MYRIEAEVAASFETRAIGLMNRPKWRRSTACCSSSPKMRRIACGCAIPCLPLSVAFLDGDGRIINIEQMQPRTEDNHLCREARALRAGDEPGLVRGTRAQAGRTHLGIPKGAPPN